MTKLFTKESIEARGQRYVGGVLLSQSLIGLRTYAFISLAVAVALILALFLPLSKSVSISGVLAPELGSYAVVSGRDGTITRQFANVGDHVVEGQPLFVISAERRTSFAQKTLAAISDGIRHRISLLEDEQRRRRTLQAMQQGRLSSRASSRQAQLEALDRQVLDGRSRVELKRSAVERYKGMEGFFPKGQIEQQQELLLQQQEGLEALLRQRTELLDDLAGIKSELQQLSLQELQIDAEKRREIARAQEELADAEARREVTVTAGVSGVVASMPAGIGQSVGSNAVLATLIPSMSGLVAELHVPSYAMAMIGPSSLVTLRLDSFPYEKYGQLEARIVQIASEPSTSVNQVNGAERMYVARAKLDRDHIAVDGVPKSLLSGMKLTGTIKSDTRRLWQWIVEPLLKERV